jgi:uncharacterized protein YkwD
MIEKRALVLAALLVLAGCGGGAHTASAPAPRTTSPPNGPIHAERTKGLIGPTARATAAAQQFYDKARPIPLGSNHVPRLLFGVAGQAGCDNADIDPRTTNQEVVNTAILCLLNAERTNASLPPLTRNAQLARSAAGMCSRIVNEQFFSHETPDGKTVVDRVRPTGYLPQSPTWALGENLAWGSGELSTPQAIMNGWMNSPGHRANILAPDYRDVGLAACHGSPSPLLTGGTVFVNDFGTQTRANLNVRLPSPAGTRRTASAATAKAKARARARARARAKARARARAKARAKRRRRGAR